MRRKRSKNNIINKGKGDESTNKRKGGKANNVGKNWHSGSVVEHPLCDQEVVGSIPGRVIPKTLKMVLTALSLGAQH